MSIRSIKYSEFDNLPNAWSISEFSLKNVNLIVGKNSAGKTRLLNVLYGLCRILSGQQTTPFQSGVYSASVDIAGSKYAYSIEFEGGKVKSENLSVDDRSVLEREADGTGHIWYEKEQEFISFSVTPDVIAVQQRKDRLQHGFVVDLSDWAQDCELYHFASSFGREMVVGLSVLQEQLSKIQSGEPAKDVISIYQVAFSKYGSKLDDAIIEDMSMLGYDIEAVGLTDVRPETPGIRIAEPAIGLFVREKGVGSLVSQVQMSQGMFRALAMVIRINVITRDGKRGTILIDDVGEGLDYERSSALIKMLVGRATLSGVQLVMTTNDRFVMNNVPLDAWSILRRHGGHVSVFNSINHAEMFEEFKYLGLSNFDFFTSNIFD